MEQATSPPAGRDARIAYVSKLPEELFARKPKKDLHRRRFFLVKRRDGTLRPQRLRPVLTYGHTITLPGHEQPLFYPTLLLTKRNSFVRGVLHGSRVHYTAIAASELTDTEVHDLTRAIRGNAGLENPEYLRIAHTNTPEAPKDTS